MTPFNSINKTYFITGIDTDAGKTIITGAIAKYLHDKGINIITQKLSQTGCINQSEDIQVHRKMMGVETYPEDQEGLTCPYVFPLPCSPHLAAKLEQTRIDPAKLKAATTELSNRYECVLVEGVGGLMVPLNEEVLLIDYLKDCNYPVILVTSGKLGSINHTLLSLDACKHRGINVVGMVFNHFGASNPVITDDTISVFREQLGKYYPEAKLVEVPILEDKTKPVDFSILFG
ncbi:dethiobiotin synthase [Parabacteroides sp. FAFU027]|uniref:dethiobiotin synthase n=1 Tax=Parabacteroides sp. FAFU027 TaxID=2922715 RepID=UPI001FAFD7F6|nr:dethiobiotin synthase [Parabacteroides sp. FAFU027]